MIKLNNIVTTFNKNTPDETKLFDNFNFNISKGDFVSVIGSNGSGKTTLLNLICGSMRPDSGSIYLGEKNITNMTEFKRSRFIGRVFQDPKVGTCSNMTVLENMALADNKNRFFGISKCLNKRNIDKYKNMIEMCGLGLENKMNVKVGSLSGGQRQALALIIASMSDIDLLILDEHTAALDPKSSETVMILTDKFIHQKNITSIMVTHNLNYSLQYGNRLIMMHEGNIVLDLDEADKKKKKINDILEKFDAISIEKGN